MTAFFVNLVGVDNSSEYVVGRTLQFRAVLRCILDVNGRNDKTWRGPSLGRDSERKVGFPSDIPRKRCGPSVTKHRRRPGHRWQVDLAVSLPILLRIPLQIINEVRAKAVLLPMMSCRNGGTNRFVQVACDETAPSPNAS